MNMVECTRTYQTRICIDSQIINNALQAYAFLFAHVKHSLFKDICAGKTPGDLKNSYLLKYGITARQFNAVRVEVEGIIRSIQELQKIELCNLKDQILSLEKSISHLKKTKKYQKLHQKKRRLHRLLSKKEKLVKTIESGKISLCFGSKKLFRAQFHLNENGFMDHNEWKASWSKARANEIFILGSKDEASGNQSCTATLEEDGSLTLRIRLPNALSQYGKYLVLPLIRFAYGHEEILASLNACKERHLLKQAKDPGFKQVGQAISYRLLIDEKGIRLFATTSLALPKWNSDKRLGVIGIDINSDHLALVETDRHGNPIFKQTIPLTLYGKTKGQSLALIGDACTMAVAHAEKVRKPIVIENLDFRKKKQTLKETAPKSQARLLSSFAYQAICTHLKSRGFKQQIEVYQVNPAYTSIIGRVKFANRYGLSIHHAAALCIGRRFLGLSERVPRHLDTVPDGKDGHVALFQPVRNRNLHVWSLWRQLSKQYQVVHAAHLRAKRSSSRVTTGCSDRYSPGLYRRNSGTRTADKTARSAFYESAHA